ncbi:Uncharacterized membrane protein YgdD, TMEM256/DUF423 family [Robiginitalea myxolifaciens]|uniref:Uncharacterized membrane protein YgdD, TMEM256/DUF423 family n=1 Tax=Robiginitalea myxolifaciens TaxID=400055 RepID=A0A1I6G909_9FLAO|nr:DUF423 domain-containing protein [Robiginitalea myxolifaciens]SFR38557.1 Uncharacterized membrane protein YgdD, TMEM256/DUF423 family [Robiginitalea myxolifaciens]
MNKTILATGAVLGGIAVVLGALGAHALEALLEPDALSSFGTATDYQMIHALFLLFLGVVPLPDSDKRWIYRLIFWGVICFSGSIYLLTLGPLLGIDPGFLFWVTPLGGLLLIGGWVLLLIRVLRSLA